MTTLKTGDVVRLKSGGPRMTVDSVEGNAVVGVTWFPSHSEMKEARFQSETLEKCDDSAKLLVDCINWINDALNKGPDKKTASSLIMAIQEHVYGMRG